MSQVPELAADGRLVRERLGRRDRGYSRWGRRYRRRPWWHAERERRFGHLAPAVHIVHAHALLEEPELSVEAAPATAEAITDARKAKRTGFV